MPIVPPSAMQRINTREKVSKESILLSKMKPAPIMMMPRIIILLGPNLSTRKPLTGPRIPPSSLDSEKTPDSAARDQPNSLTKDMKKALKP